MKIIYCKWFPPKGNICINIFGLIIARTEYKPLNKYTINHEAIHTAQMKEMLYVFFYLWYGIEWIINLIRYGNKDDAAYYHIKFEKEAYANEKDLTYLNNRKHYAWLNYK